GVISPEGTRWRYGYDAFGRRISKRKEEDTAGPPVKPTAIIGYDYLWSGEQLIEETPVYADGTVGYENSIHWLYEPGALTPSARFEKGQLYYVVSDHQGTVREILTEAGELIWAGRLLTWGEPECWPVLTVNDPRNLTCNLRFCGQYEDEESGLYYNRFRYYDNETGQYLCADPIGLAGGENPYSYVHNPANWIDPLGLAGCPTDYSQKRKYWSSDPITFKGNKVYQRNDLFDPQHMSAWRDQGKVIRGTNIERMASGRAPVGHDGKAVNLHHMLQTQNGPIAEMSQTFHKVNHKAIHINPNTIPSGIDRATFNKWREQYWINRAGDFK
ncbi:MULTISPECIES: HNH/ENDO VII family nuclease, partial [Photorhabdus]